MLVFEVIDRSLSETSPLGDALDVCIRREDAARFIEDVRKDDPKVAGLCGSRSVS
jgi:hypothetical protein